jgi:hypothetical protein
MHLKMLLRLSLVFAPALALAAVDLAVKASVPTKAQTSSFLPACRSSSSPLRVSRSVTASGSTV